MSNTNLKRAIVKFTGEEIYVYRIHSRGTWCNSKDCKTEYRDEELTIYED